LLRSSVGGGAITISEATYVGVYGCSFVRNTGEVGGAIDIR